MDNGRLASF